jgi:hypothetical protein
MSEKSRESLILETISDDEGELPCSFNENLYDTQELYDAQCNLNNGVLGDNFTVNKTLDNGISPIIGSDTFMGQSANDMGNLDSPLMNNENLATGISPNMRELTITNNIVKEEYYLFVKSLMTSYKEEGLSWLAVQEKLDSVTGIMKNRGGPTTVIDGILEQLARDISSKLQLFS